MDNFDLRKYLVENKLTVNTRRSSIFERFLNGETEYKTLKELLASLKESTADITADANQDIAALTPEEQKAAIAFAVDTAGNIQSSDDITRDTFGQKFMTWMKDKEGEYGDLSKKIQNKVRAAKILVGALAATVLINLTGSVAGKTVTTKITNSDKVSQETNLTFQQNLKSDLGDDATADYAKAQAAIKQNKAFDTDPNGNELHLQMKTGESDIEPTDAAEIGKLSKIIKQTLDKKPGSKATATVAVGASNQGTKASNKSNKNTDLTQDRIKAVEKELTSQFKENGIEKDVTIIIKTVPYKNSKVTTASDNNPTQGATLSVDFKSPEQSKTTQQLVKTFQDYRINPPLPKTLAPTGDKEAPADEKPAEPTTFPADTATPKPAKNTNPKITPEKPSDGTTIPTSGEQESSQRNTQLAVLLKAIAGEVDTFKELGVPYNSRLTQATMNKAQTSKGKDYVALVTAIRKNPDYFLGKVSKLTGQDLSGREKMASIFGEGLITENTIDDLLVKVGITDDIIKSKGKTIVDYLRKVYKLSGAGTAPNQPTSTAVPKDIQNIQNSMDRNKTLDTSLGKVDRADELTTLLVGMVQYVEDNLKKDPNNALSTLQATKTELPKHYNPSTTTGGSNFSYSVVKEENVIPADTSRVLDLINKYPNLVRLLKTVNNRQELKALILLVISSVNPILSSAKEKVSTAITNATNILRSQKQDK